ncbi:MAG: CBS domain-containing protein [Caldilinea sp.]|uniref:CBS domain-containing protein n=1 Tax=Caldilinea sp. TaxID=2293560 RepID=UPI002C314446|nr:CBS domain-containing protein [Caldilinea sp.]
MATVKQILDGKGYQVWTITADKMVYDALRLMGEKEIGALAVVEGGMLVGILSERDYARKVVLRGKTSRETLIREIMTSPAICIRPDQSVAECMTLMTDKRIRHLPVLDNGKLIGMISLGDLVKSVIDEQQFTIQQLEGYIGQ